MSRLPLFALLLLTCSCSRNQAEDSKAAALTRAQKRCGAVKLPGYVGSFKGPASKQADHDIIVEFVPDSIAVEWEKREAEFCFLKISEDDGSHFVAEALYSPDDAEDQLVIVDYATTPQGARLSWHPASETYDARGFLSMKRKAPRYSE